jgi:hypothetical protein
MASREHDQHPDDELTARELEWLTHVVESSTHALPVKVLPSQELMVERLLRKLRAHRAARGLPPLDPGEGTP